MVNQFSKAAQLLLVKRVKEHDVRSLAQQSLQCRGPFVWRQGDFQDVEQGGPLIRLASEVEAQVAFIRRRDGMFAHRRMAVQTERRPFVSESREEISKNAIPAQRRRRRQ